MYFSSESNMVVCHCCLAIRHDNHPFKSFCKRAHRGRNQNTHKSISPSTYNMAVDEQRVAHPICRCIVFLRSVIIVQRLPECASHLVIFALFIRCHPSQVLCGLQVSGQCSVLLQCYRFAAWAISPFRTRSRINRFVAPFVNIVLIRMHKPLMRISYAVCRPAV